MKFPKSFDSLRRPAVTPSQSVKEVMKERTDLLTSWIEYILQHVEPCYRDPNPVMDGRDFEENKKVSDNFKKIEDWIQNWREESSKDEGVPQAD